MTGVDVVVYVLIGLIGSFFSGMLGVGGAILTYPLLYFVPPLFGAYAMSPIEISSATMFQVFASSGIGMLMYRRSPWFSRQVVLIIGGGMLFGSLVGGFLSGMIDGVVIHLLYGTMALAAVVIMVGGQRGELSDEIGAGAVIDRSRAILLSSVVGILSGIVGAGGSFLLIPLMINVLKLPTRTAISCSLTIVFLSSIGGVIGKVSAGHTLYALSFLLVIASLVGSWIGAKVGQKMNVRLLRLVMIGVILLSALQIWGELIWQWWVLR
ncbi:sulfite exporter TauE/SafE family protein [Tumebacillus lipolyticus]|uniref:Probable membrane transporter protein n=1 Tax=Tumebacillus lipolyticus TaxID=1280370 RepID=A0ABW4ZSE3_9BACL